MNNGKLTAILLNLYQNHRSGILRFERRTEKKQLVLTEGYLSFAESNQPTEHLAKIMTDLRLLPTNKLREIALLMKKGMSCEEALLAISDIKREQIIKGVSEQALTILASLWRWDEPTVNFYAGDNILPRKVKIGMALPDAIILSARQAVSRRQYSAPGNFIEGRIAATGELMSVAGVSQMPFNDSEAAVIVNLQKPMNTIDLMTQVATRSGNPEDAILTLLAIGLVRFQSPEEIILDTSDPNDMVKVLENILRRLGKATHYDILSVARDVSPDALQDAYHRLARQLHPDRFQSKEFAADIPQKAQKAFAAVNQAYFTLKDPLTREAYNEQLAHASQSSEDINISEEEKMAETFLKNGRAFIAKREYEKAVEMLKGSVWIRPHNAKYNHYLGVAEAAIPKLRKDAETHFLKALELDETSVATNLELARLYLEVRLNRKAEKHLELLRKLDPDNEEAQKLRAKLSSR